MERICSFFGHRNVFVDLRDKIENAAKKVISEYGVNTFYVGDRGEFDRQSVSAICSLKHEYPNIKLILVLPYLTNKLNTYKEYYQQQFDEIVIPSVLDDVHPKGAITRRNRWMVEQSSYIISYINRDHSGAYTAVSYAKKKKLPINNLGSFEI